MNAYLRPTDVHCRLGFGSRKLLLEEGQLLAKPIQYVLLLRFTPSGKLSTGSLCVPLCCRQRGLNVRAYLKRNNSSSVFFPVQIVAERK